MGIKDAGRDSRGKNYPAYFCALLAIILFALPMAAGAEPVALTGERIRLSISGLGPEQLNEGRDLALTTDFRTVLSEVLIKHQGNTSLKSIFPGFTADPKKYLNLLQS